MIANRNALGQTVSRPLSERLELGITRSEGCWIWHGAKAGRGLYGMQASPSNIFQHQHATGHHGKTRDAIDV